MLTASQCRAARALLNWSQPDLAKHAGVHVQTISAFEKDHGSPSKTTLQKITLALEIAGIEFTDSNGVKERKGDVRMLRGHKGVMEWYEDLYTVGEHDKRPFLLSNVNEDAFLKIIGRDFLEKHRNKVKKLELRYKILVKEGNTNFISSDWGEYRWTPKEVFGHAQFFVYGDKLSILMFEQEIPEIIVIHYPEVAESYRLQFQMVWNNAYPVNNEKQGAINAH